VFIKLSGVGSVEEAEELRGAGASVPRKMLERLPEGQFYRFEIVGLKVYDVQGDKLGEVVDVLSTGGNDVYVVHGKRGEVLVPAIEDVVREVDGVDGWS
jgi:16S rRNA processing protein RimM